MKMKKQTKKYIFFGVIGILAILIFGQYFGLFTSFGEYAITEEYTLSGSGQFTSVSSKTPLGWIDTGSCINPNNGRYNLCPMEEQEYTYLTQVCTNQEMREGAIYLYYTYTSNYNVLYCEGSRCDGYATLYGLNSDGEYISLGTTDSLYTGSAHLGEAEYFKHSVNNIKNAFNGNCLDIYLGKYWWSTNDEVSGTIVLNKAIINYDPIREIQIYRLQDNSCVQLNIMEDELTENDYLTESQCLNAINEVDITVYRLSENCDSITLKPSNKQSGDFDTQSECLSNLESESSNYLIYIMGGITALIVLGFSWWLVKR